MNNNTPRYNELLNELLSQLPEHTLNKESTIQIHLKGEYSSKLKKKALHMLGYSPESKKIGKNFSVIKL